MKRLLAPVVLTTLLTFSASAPAAIPAEIRIDSGAVAGTTGTSPDVRIFRGIPFAAPPIGANRWRAPQPIAKWDGVRAATEFGPRCTQGGGPGAPGAPPPPPTGEDCLYLNVWTTALSADERRPVMVWIYGGGYAGGAGSEPRYGGEELAKKGAIVVTLNYRLGSLGFLAHPELTKESGRSGNYGMMDAIAALQWVQRNIAAFGGDPRNVTVFGESAGANMTAALVGSPAAKGLFHRSIAQSGAWMGLGMGRMTPLAAAEERGAKAVADFGAKSIAELRAKPAAEVIAGVRGGLGLVIDGLLIPEDLSVTFAAGKQNPVDLLVGSNKDEGTFFPRPGLTAAQFTTGANERFGATAADYLKFYPAGSDTQAGESYLASFSDEVAWHVRTFAQTQAKRGSKAFLYYFTRVPPSPPDRPSRGASHVVELNYMFNNLLPGTPWTDVDKKLADTMSSYWVNFARAGDPNGPGLPQWPEFGASSKAQVLGDTVATQTAPTPATPILTFLDAAYQQQMKSSR